MSINDEYTSAPQPKPKQMMCDRCNGSGYVWAEGNCPTCGGDGWIAATKHENTCDECGLPISICNAKAMFEMAVSRNGREAVIAAILDAKTEQTEQPTPEAVTRLIEARSENERCRALEEAIHDADQTLMLLGDTGWRKRHHAALAAYKGAGDELIPHDPRQPPHRKEAISFSAHEALMIRAALVMPVLDPDEQPTWANTLSKREWEAFVGKINHIK